MTFNIWRFDDTVEAYSACQCDENIKTGDVLVIPSEGVVGIADTWPFAITEQQGHLHGLKITPREFFVKHGLNLEALACAEEVAYSYTQTV